MSSALAIAGVSAVLQFYLTNLYADPSVSALFGGTVQVSAKAPDLIQELVTKDSTKILVNIFLHQVTHNQGWRNQDLPSATSDGRTRLSSPQLALDLHYLLTAYGVDDWQAEALLGFALLMLHENPVLTRNDVSNAVTKLPAQDPSNLLSSPLGSAGLAEQVELLKITPTILGREEMAWLWTALKADYRPTYPFQVSVVLLQSQHPASSTLPVLSRNIVAQPSILPLITLPTLTAVLPPKGQAAAALDDVVMLTGSNLGIVTDVLLVNPIRQFQRTLAVTGTPPVFTVQNTHSTNDPPAGFYQISAQFPGVPGLLNSNSLPFAIAPDISTWSPGIIPSGATTLTVPCKPFVQPGQDVSLIIGDQQAPANPFAVATNMPSFTYANLQQTGGPVPARMRVDGVDSAIIDMTATPPQFNPALMVTVV